MLRSTLLPPLLLWPPPVQAQRALETSEQFTDSLETTAVLPDPDEREAAVDGFWNALTAAGSRAATRLASVL